MVVLRKAVLVGALWVGACALLGGTGRVEVGRLPLGANDDFPLKVDLVVVYDRELKVKLGGMAAADWFTERAQIQSDSPPEALEVFSWEWVPGQMVEDQEIRYRVGARATLIFASYSSSGDHRVHVQPGKSLRLDLGETSFTAETSN